MPRRGPVIPSMFAACYAALMQNEDLHVAYEAGRFSVSANR